jgi:hypothetical protein
VKYQVPQFIETETKLIGPLTLKQFLFVAGGVSVIAMEFILLSGVIFMVLAFITAALFGALAFLKIDGQPFINYLAYMLAYGLGAKQYIYRPDEQTDRFNLKP